jgi:hypothetical protein
MYTCRTIVRLPIFACLLSTAMLLAQTPTAVINGTVVDSTGASVPNAKVVAVNQGMNVAREKATATDGSFTIINLLPGNYVLTVEAGGLDPGIRCHCKVLASRSARLDTDCRRPEELRATKSRLV